MTRLEPVHPGEVLKHDFMEPFALSAAALAKAIGVTPARINEIVRGRRGITAGTALRLAQYFSTDARSWMNLQVRYELEVAARNEADALRVIRPCEEDRNDPLTKDFNETLAAYERLLTEKNGRRTPASRTRQKIANKGVRQSLVEWTRRKIETEGFKLLVEKGLSEYTGEYLVVRYQDQFPPDVVDLARKRLAEHDIEEPKFVRP